MGKPLSFSKIPLLHLFSVCMTLNYGNLNLWLFKDDKYGIVQTSFCVWLCYDTERLMCSDMVKFSLHKHEGLSLDSQHPCKSQMQ